MRRRALALAVGGTALGSAVWGGAAWSSRLPLAPPIVVEAAFDTRLDTLRRDEPVAAIFIRRGVPRADVQRVLNAAPQLDPRRVRAGRVFDFRYPLGASQPDRVATRLDDERFLRVVRGTDGAWRGDIERVGWQAVQHSVVGTIGSSLYDALHRMLPDTVLPPGEVDRFIADLADDVFGSEIDFSRDVLAGDGYGLVFERLTSSMGDVRYGRLLAARIDTRGTDNRAYVVTGEGGRNRYYDERGISLRRAFKKSPVAYLRISSRFSAKRYHPVLGTWRAHRGTDFSARSGTEITATGGGVVRMAGRNGGYGLMVAIRHPGKEVVETRYAHMSRLGKGIRTGTRVEQGRVIGYVGASGLANGPHVHYEFIKKGRQINPQAADLGDGTPLPDEQRGEYVALRNRLAPLLAPPVPRQVAAGSNARAVPH
ncbi:MAG: M23 family metallopeptidase [Gemmatimonadetes bacterium]|nr:M23 family metallopeptidase [Gemmatimonadota bacterium]